MLFTTTNNNIFCLRAKWYWKVADCSDAADGHHAFTMITIILSKSPSFGINYKIVFSRPRSMMPSPFTLNWNCQFTPQTERSVMFPRLHCKVKVLVFLPLWIVFTLPLSVCHLCFLMFSLHLCFIPHLSVCSIKCHLWKGTRYWTFPKPSFLSQLWLTMIPSMHSAWTSL